MVIRLSMLVAACFIAGSAWAQVDTTYVEDGERVLQLETVTVTSSRLSWNRSTVSAEKDALYRVMERSGIALVRRGSILGSDVYLDGFKRGDVEMVIDGERFPNSCPNRMDPPAVRLNPLELASVQLDRSAAAGQAGLAGRLSMQRAEPQVDWGVKVGAMQSGGSESTSDLSLALERLQHRVALRVLRGGYFHDGADHSFADRYGYREGESPLELYEGSFLGAQGKLGYGFSASFARNMAFPYLLMDERTNGLVGGHLAYGNHKLYVNRTHHVMDNGLRLSAGSMQMESVAQNLTAGFVGPAYELYYRRWTVDNRIIMGSGMTIDQASIPDLYLVSASTFDERSFGWLSVAGRLGVHVVGVHQNDRMDFYRTLFPEAASRRIFIPFATSVSVSQVVGDRVMIGGAVEAASEPPAAEHLYIGVQRAMTRPWWSGNPDLAAQKRLSARAVFNMQGVDVQAYASRLRDYVSLDHRTVAERRYVTYEGIDAAIAGVNAGWTGAYVDAFLRYTYGHDLTFKQPLAEIQPLRFGVTLRSPSLADVQGYLRLECAAAQGRISTRLDEERSPAWARFDTGVSWSVGRTAVSLDVDNLFDASYYDHLSFPRDPFASGTAVYAPGRTVRVAIVSGY